MRCEPLSFSQRSRISVVNILIVLPSHLTSIRWLPSSGSFVTLTTAPGGIVMGRCCPSWLKTPASVYSDGNAGHVSAFGPFKPCVQMLALKNNHFYAEN